MTHLRAPRNILHNFNLKNTFLLGGDGMITAVLLKKNSAVVITCLYEWADLWIFIKKYEFHVCMDMVRNRSYMKIQHENLDLIRDLQKSPWELWYKWNCSWGCTNFSWNAWNSLHLKEVQLMSELCTILNCKGSGKVSEYNNAGRRH